MIDIHAIRRLDKKKLRDYILLNGIEQNELFEKARNIRKKSQFGDNVELRSVIEISNICAQQCKYCSMGKNGKDLFVLSEEEILNRICSLAEKGRRTFLLQSGEISKQSFIDSISRVCERTVSLYPDIKLILCLGNLSNKQYKQLLNSGATRYILKFETSNSQLHKFCRPTDTFENRLECINNLINLGFKVGSGNIIGLPNQTIDDLLEDLELINNLNLSMVSATKFIPNNFSEFKDYNAGDINTTINFLAILRILKPNCLIPATSSLEQGSLNGQIRGLMAGCNTITIHDGTPKEFEKNYSIYSDDRFTPGESYCRRIVQDANMESVPFLI